MARAADGGRPPRLPEAAVTDPGEPDAGELHVDEAERAAAEALASALDRRLGGAEGLDPDAPIAEDAPGAARPTGELASASRLADAALVDVALRAARVARTRAADREPPRDVAAEGVLDRARLDAILNDVVGSAAAPAPVAPAPRSLAPGAAAPVPMTRVLARRPSRLPDRGGARGVRVAVLGVAASMALAAGVVLALRATVGLGGQATFLPASEPPPEACARPADALFPGGFDETPAPTARLDRIVRSRTRGYFAALAFAGGAR